jgi:hypothetical protein
VPVIHFLGSILPEITGLTVHHHVKTTWPIPELEITPLFEVEVADSKIDVKREVSTYDPDRHFMALFTRAQDLCRVDANISAFATGFGIRAILSSVVEPGGVERPLLIHYERLAELCTASKLDRGFNEAHLLVINNIRVNFILNDLINALMVPHSQAINCARVMDGIKHYIAPDEKYDKNSWRRMQNTLNIDESYIKKITDASRDARRGKIPVLTNQDPILERSGAIMNRFIEYLKRGGSQPLPIAEFPSLTG